MGILKTWGKKWVRDIKRKSFLLQIQNQDLLGLSELSFPSVFSSASLIFDKTSAAFGACEFRHDHQWKKKIHVRKSNRNRGVQTVVRLDAAGLFIMFHNMRLKEK